MYFNYREIDFDINEKYVNEEQAKKFFNKAIDLSNKVQIWEINIEDDDTSYIYLLKQGEYDVWDKETIEYVEILQNNNYDVMYADEYYGMEFDVIIIYNSING